MTAGLSGKPLLGSMGPSTSLPAEEDEEDEEPPEERRGCR